MSTQKTKILKHLQSGRCITPQEAIDLYRCYRLTAVIYVLKQEGILIDKIICTGEGQIHWAEYSLAKFDIARII